MKILFLTLAGEAFTQREILVGALKPTYENLRFSQVPNGPLARIPERIYRPQNGLKH